MPSGSGLPGQRCGIWRRINRNRVFTSKVCYTVHKPDLGSFGSKDSLDITIQNRLKDQNTVTGQWSAELTSANPWFKDFVLNVCDSGDLDPSDSI
jgi:hypothetical protein